MTGPVWDGRGVDPWLPRRLADQKTITVGERTIYDDYFGRLSAWMVKAKRALDKQPTINADPLWALVPEWVQSMAEFVQTSVEAMVGAAYATLLGPAYRFDQRPSVMLYLGEAQNRLVDLPEQVYDLVVEQIAEGAGAGESLATVRDRVQRVFDTTGTPYWPNRAAVVARTETLGALNAGRDDAFRAVAQELGDNDFEKGWLATHDTKVRPTHLAADLGTPITGQRVPLDQPFIVGGHKLMRPGDPNGPAAEVIQCRCTELLLRPGEEVDLTNRQFLDY